MRIFFMIIGAILVIAALSVFWAYSSFKYQPDYFNEIEKTNFSEIQHKGSSVESRIREELTEKGEAKVSAEDITSIFISQVNRRSKVDLKPILKKVNSEIVDGQLKMEALVNAKELTKQKMPAKAREYLDIFLANAPEDMLEEVYISFTGTPVKYGSHIKFDENAQINIGDFSYDLSAINGSRDFKMDTSLLSRLGISDFEVLEDQILLLK